MTGPRVCFHRQCCSSFAVFAGHVPRTHQGDLPMRVVSRFVISVAVAASGLLLAPAATAGAAPSSATSVRVSALAPKRALAPIPGQPSTYKKFAPDSYTPPEGPKFNNPYGSMTSRRALLTHVIRAINSSPGYRLPAGIDPATGKRAACPTNPKD